MKYFIKIDIEDAPWFRVTEKEFRSLERAAGFNRPTASFSGGGITGTTTDTWPVKWDASKNAYVRDWNVVTFNRRSKCP